MADRWVSTPHVFPNCCHRCLKSGEDDGPYFHEEWDYCQPQRWPGASPDAPRVARKFTCRKCLQHALNSPGAPSFDDARVAELEAEVKDLNAELDLLQEPIHRPIEVVDVAAVLQLLEDQKPKRATAKRKAA